MKKNIVIGCINMDLGTVCERALDGGKGTDQAVTMGKMGYDVTVPGETQNFVGELKEAVWEKQ